MSDALKELDAFRQELAALKQRLKKVETALNAEREDREWEHTVNEYGDAAVGL